MKKGIWIGSYSNSFLIGVFFFFFTFTFKINNNILIKKKKNQTNKQTSVRSWYKKSKFYK